jgi:DNA-3-methyladenine glycosylase II
MEQVPLTEKPLIEAASRAYGHGRDLSRADLAQLAERYGPYQGYWAHYLRVGA